MDLVISNARLRGRDDLVDVGVANGRIAEIAAGRALMLRARSVWMVGW